MRCARSAGAATRTSIVTLALIAAALPWASNATPAAGTTAALPGGHPHLDRDPHGRLRLIHASGDTLREAVRAPDYSLRQMRILPRGTADGVRFDFGDSSFAGRLYYGLIPDQDAVDHRYPLYGRHVAAIEAGRAEADVRGRLAGKYDVVDWEEEGRLRLGYRVVSHEGDLIYDGRITLKGTGPFRVDTCLVEGPLLSRLSDHGAVISFATSHPAAPLVAIAGRRFLADGIGLRHEIEVTGLTADQTYPYEVRVGDEVETYRLRTAPLPGSRRPFTFAYASDGRANTGGGERNLYGLNAYILKRIAALIRARDARFMQFTGDLVTGNTIAPAEIRLQYANWKRTVEPYAAYLPFVAGFGNHEGVFHGLLGDSANVWIDRFPYETESGEALFAAAFANPHNGPDSEDGTAYDPDPRRRDFPPYDETAFWYTYDNVAVISLNSNYWFAPSVRRHPAIGGNPHGYIMDAQLDWLRATLQRLERDAHIDHVFVTVHTPLFPNGGHVGDDMWYRGDNRVRPHVAGRPYAEGIIERRDALLEVAVNQTTKVVAFLTGDEHNYSRLRITEAMPRYPQNYDGPRLALARGVWQINNGAAGAPYYGREETPWAQHVRAFSTQNAVVLFHVAGPRVTVEVLNPDTLEELDRFDL